jgi:DNA mismatch repair protein MutL
LPPPRSEAGRAAGKPSFLQIHRSYIATESSDGLRLIDQHAIHERQLFDALLDRVARADPEAQNLLIPEVIDLTAQDQALLLEAGEALSALGVVIEEFGPASVCVRAVPALFGRISPADVVLGALEILQEKHGDTEITALARRLAAELACRAAVKFNDALAPEEISALLEWWARHPEARYCPHGRPVAVSISLLDLEQQFLRKR